MTGEIKNKLSNSACWLDAKNRWIPVFFPSKTKTFSRLSKIIIAYVYSTRRLRWSVLILIFIGEQVKHGVTEVSTFVFE